MCTLTFVFTNPRGPRYAPMGDRYDLLRACVGDDVVQKLRSTKLFMVGCGAIGCEMLKNYALIGVGSSGEVSLSQSVSQSAVTQPVVKWSTGLPVRETVGSALPV